MLQSFLKCSEVSDGKVIWVVGRFTSIRCLVCAALAACLSLSVYAQEIKGFGIAPDRISPDSMEQETAQWGFTWYCTCNGTFVNQFTTVPTSSTGLIPTQVSIDSISVSGDLASSSEYLQFKLSGAASYITYQGVADTSTYSTYSYTGPQPSLTQNNEGLYGFPVDLIASSSVDSVPAGMDPSAYFHLRINMTVTYEDSTVISLGLGQATTISSIAQGEQQRLYVDVGPDQAARFSALRIGTRGGTGEVDLFVGKGFLPTPYQNYTCASDNVGNEELCDLTDPSGRFYASVFAFDTSTLIDVYATGLGPPDAPVLNDAKPENQSTILKFNVPASNGAAITTYTASCDIASSVSDTLSARDDDSPSASDATTWSINRVQDSQKTVWAENLPDGMLLMGPVVGVGAQLPERLILDSFDGARELKVLAARTTPSDNYFLTGEGTAGESFNILLTPDGTVIGKVVSEDNTLLISASEQRSVSILRSVVDSGLKPMPFGQDLVPPDTEVDDDPVLESLETTHSSTVDLMILLDPNLSQAAADYAVQYTNDIHARSGTGLQFVATSFRSYSISSSPLSTITNSSQVASWRDTDRADLVAYLGPLDSSYGYCGQAYVPGANDSSFSGNIKRLGFSVNFVGSDGGYFCTDEVLAHELGHNLGNAHDLANSGLTPYRPYGYGDGISGVYGTVQSYLSPEQGKFSNPNLTCAGNNPCGRYSYTNVVQAIDDVRGIAAEVYSGSGGGGDPGSQFVVSPSAGFGGTVSPSSPQTVNDGGTASFTLSPRSGYAVDAVSGTCNGVLDGNTYTVTVDGTDCSFNGSFTPSGKYYSVNVTANSGGIVTPLGVTKVVPFDTLPIHIQPSGGFSIASISNTCEGSFSSGTLTTGAITSDCSVNVGFARTGSVVSGNGAPITVDQLSNGIEYTCAVTATNSYGASLESNTLTVIPNIQYVAPGAPTITKVVGEDGEVLVYFTPGSTGNLPVTYTATCDLGFSPPTLGSASSTGSPIRVSGLTNGIPVFCTVTAENSKGAATSSSVSATPEELPAAGLPIWLLYKATQP
jgi:hypothetical protein